MEEDIRLLIRTGKRFYWNYIESGTKVGLYWYDQKEEGQEPFLRVDRSVYEKFEPDTPKGRETAETWYDDPEDDDPEMTA